MANNSDLGTLSINCRNKKCGHSNDLRIKKKLKATRIRDPIAKTTTTRAVLMRSRMDHREKSHGSIGSNNNCYLSCYMFKSE
ncbi:Protein CBG06788 [Caenorhabditis briggsae]|uniref:Ubiquitin-ribosomal protein eL40 fusion protein n=1 Tax=Caenorhabditis briggsae TaxID=6238 RepID=A8X328_CAEBR|nr:Protein CBG06788 [Caenorhabditis briggsae]CAP27038.1 Protein CBG06788 [Caenorhabditis briggsae]